MCPNRPGIRLLTCVLCKFSKRGLTARSSLSEDICSATLAPSSRNPRKLFRSSPCRVAAVIAPLSEASNPAVHSGSEASVVPWTLTRNRRNRHDSRTLTRPVDHHRESGRQGAHGAGPCSALTPCFRDRAVSVDAHMARSRTGRGPEGHADSIAEWLRATITDEFVYWRVESEVSDLMHARVHFRNYVNYPDSPTLDHCWYVGDVIRKQ